MSNIYRTHTCGQLRPEHVGQQARLSGWVQRKRDHGNLLFIDLRDHYGVTQVVVDVSSPVFKTAEAVRNESVITVTGKAGAGWEGFAQLLSLHGKPELASANVLSEHEAEGLDQMTPQSQTQLCWNDPSIIIGEPTIRSRSV